MSKDLQKKNKKFQLYGDLANFILSLEIKLEISI